MSEQDSHVSLIDLREQFAFAIDDKIKKALCFTETLIVSCAHYEAHESSEGSKTTFGESEASEFVCSSTTTYHQEEVADEQVQPCISEPIAADEEQIQNDDDPFAFFFFADCNKPLPEQRSNQSIILDPDGMPMINPAAEFPKWCKCKRTRKGVCECFVKIPCKCGARTHEKCTCEMEKEICICEVNNPAPKCRCHKRTGVCTCFPGPPQPDCICEEVEKPCICDKDRFPFPICECKSKPKSVKPSSLAKRLSMKKRRSSIKEGLEGAETEEETEEGEIERELEQEIEQETTQEIEEETEEEMEEETITAYVTDVKRSKRKSRVTRIEEHKGEEEPCTCQQPEKKPCLCRAGEKCICEPTNECTCGEQNECVCPLRLDPAEMPCVENACVTKPICDCIPIKICTCKSFASKSNTCSCYPEKIKICTCGADPEDCVCQKVCDCIAPCICDIKSKPITCICSDMETQLREKHPLCTCARTPTPGRKLKKVQVGKHGWRHCPEVDPYHTFFDYAYGKHHLIEQKEQEKEKFKILGIYSETEEACPIHKEELPRFQKNVRKPSLDCCSSVGGLTISVDVLGGESDKFLINVISHASKEGAKTGSKLVGIVDLNLHTLEENRIECITKGDVTKERKSYFAICDVGYYNKVTRICGDRKTVKRLYHKFEHAKDFLLEGASLILMRYLALTRYKGSLKTRTVLVDGSICDSIYVCLGVSQAIVNGTPLFVVKIERSIVEASGFIHQTSTVLSLRGYMISHEWHDNNYLLHINPLLRVFPDKDLIEEHVPLREKWREDMQLFSDFLNHKATRTGEGARYVSENGGLTATVRDYLQAILLLKPDEVIHFTRHYFDSVLSAIDLPREEYFDSCNKRVRYYYLET